MNADALRRVSLLVGRDIQEARQLTASEVDALLSDAYGGQPECEVVDVEVTCMTMVTLAGFPERMRCGVPTPAPWCPFAGEHRDCPRHLHQQ